MFVSCLGYLMACAAPNIAVAMAVAPPITVPIMLFSGFYLNLRSVPTVLVWCPYVSWLRYGFEGWSIVQWREYGPGSIRCEANELGCMTAGEMILEYYHFYEVSVVLLGNFV